MNFSKLVYKVESLSIKPMQGNGVVYLTILVPLICTWCTHPMWVSDLHAMPCHSFWLNALLFISIQMIQSMILQSKMLDDFPKFNCFLEVWIRKEGLFSRKPPVMPKGLVPLSKGCTRKTPYFIPQKIPLTNQIYLENEWNACVIHLMGTTQ